MAKPPGKGPSRASRTAQTSADRTQAGRTQAGRTQAGRTQAGRTLAAKAKLAGAHAARTEAGRAKAGKAAPGKATPGKAAAGKASPAGSAAGGTRAAKSPAADAPAGKGQASKVGAGKAGAGKARATAQSAAGRQLTERVKTARGRKTSSQRWLQRQLNDPYVAAAKAQGYRSRAAWKLAEMDDRFRLLKPGARILDLGAAPGGWAQVAVERCGRNARIVALDINPMDPVPGAEVLLGDILDAETPARIRAALDGPADLVLSDMAPPATGHRQTDHIRIMALCEGRAGPGLRGAGAGRQLPLQGAAGRRRGQPAAAHEAGFPHRAPCQAAGQPQRQRRGLCHRTGLSRRTAGRGPGPRRSGSRRPAGPARRLTRGG